MSSRALFLDIGGVLATNGWDSDTRAAAVQRFGLDRAELDGRHRMTFDTYEIGRLSLDTYLDRTVFHIPRPFTKAEFSEWIFEQSRPFPDMMELMRDLKRRHGLKVFVVSNEGRELTEHRIKKFELGSLVDCFVSSCFVNLRKPDIAIYRMALDMAHVPAEEVVYVDDRAMFVEVAATMGIPGIRHVSYEGTKAALAGFGLA